MLDLARVNNSDMRATYRYGDALLVKKIFNTYTTNDVVYFELPEPDSVMTRTFLFQRIAGLPGDSIRIVDKLVYVNGTPLPEPATLQHNYFLRTRLKADSSFKLKYELEEGGEISDKFDHSFSFTKHIKKQLESDSLVKSIEERTEKRGANDITCFPGTAKYAWNRDQYGHLYIPKINDTLLLDTNTISLYEGIIREHEHNQLEQRGDSIFINGELSKKYLVKKNYYFVLGDNRDNANDSRLWGYLPAGSIMGKVVLSLRRQ